MKREMESHEQRGGGLPATALGTVVTVGTFDGVHRGHWAVLTQLDQRAEALNLPSLLVTFDPHPLKIVRPEIAPRLLTTADEKKEILAVSGLDYAAFLPFTRSLSLYSPREFVEEVLLGRFRMRHLVIGYDHGFGRGRQGDVETLQRIGAEVGFAVDVVGPVAWAGAPISSSRIRASVAGGDVEFAAAALGRPYSIGGPVVRGEGRGRDLGFPTANIRVPEGDKLVPLEGIYAVRASAGVHLGPGLLHLGPRPTFRGSPPSVELHLLDFRGDLYGAVVRVDFLKRLRDIVPFRSAGDLMEQMRRDREEAERYFAEGAVGRARNAKGP